MKRPLILCVFIGGLFYACSSTESRVDKIVADYYQTLSQRQDVYKFMDFYDEDIVLEDIINGDRIIGKEEVSIFFDWDNPQYENINEVNLEVREKIIDRNKAVIKGYFTSFKWGDYEFEAMHFTTILTFNESGKIIHQVDWINYPATLVNYNERKSSNKWIK